MGQRGEINTLKTHGQEVQPSLVGVKANKTFLLSGTVEYSENGHFLMRVTLADGTVAVGTPA